MANVKTVAVTCTLANTAYNLATGTTAAPTTPRDNKLVGAEVTIQNQTTGSVLTFGGSDVVTVGGLKISYLGAFSMGSLTLGSSGVQLQDLWVTSDTGGAVVVVLLRKSV